MTKKSEILMKEIERKLKNSKLEDVKLQGIPIIQYRTDYGDQPDRNEWVFPQGRGFSGMCTKGSLEYHYDIMNLREAIFKEWRNQTKKLRKDMNRANTIIMNDVVGEENDER